MDLDLEKKNRFEGLKRQTLQTVQIMGVRVTRGLEKISLQYDNHFLSRFLNKFRNDLSA